MRRVLLAAIVCGLAAMNFRIGIGEDPDAYLVLQRALAFPEHGYAPSRTWGFPGYELVAYPLIAYAGDAAAKAWSLACVALASVTFLALLDRLTTDRRRALAGAIGFAVLPVTIVASTTVLETAQGVLLGIAALLAWTRWRQSREDAVVWWYVCAAALGLAMSTRPDYVLLAAALAIVACVGERTASGAHQPDERAGPSMPRPLEQSAKLHANGGASMRRMRALPALPHAIAGIALMAACAGLPYLALYGAFPFRMDVVPPDPWIRRVARAAFGAAALIGLPALVLLAGWATRQMLGALRRPVWPVSPMWPSWSMWPLSSRRSTLRDGRGRDSATRDDATAVALAVARRDVLLIASLAGVCYFVRFVMLPDELDYIVILAPLLIAAVVSSRMSTTMVMVFVGGLAVPNVVQGHLFERTPAGTIALAPGISSGAIAQERAARRRTLYVHQELPPLLARAAARFGLRDYTTDPVPGSDRPAIIPEDALRFYRADRRGGAFHASAARSRIIVYPLAMGRGWRQFLEPDAWRPVSIADFREADGQDLSR